MRRDIGDIPSGINPARRPSLFPLTITTITIWSSAPFIYFREDICWTSGDDEFSGFCSSFPALGNYTAFNDAPAATMADDKELRAQASSQADAEISPPLENTAKSRWERSWPTIACGAGLFSDGYL